MSAARCLAAALAVALLPGAGFAAPAGSTPAPTAELTEIREIEALDQKTLDVAEAAFFEGLGHYRAGRFEQAALAFQKAYTLTHHRDMLFNVARSREKLGDVPGAVEWYRGYLATRPADETAVIHRIRQLGAEPVVQGPVRPVHGGPQPAVTTVEKGPGPWPWVAAGVGAAALVGGTVLGFMALSEASSARKAELRPTAQKHKDAAESRALLADVCFSTATVAAAAAVFLWWRADAEAAGLGQIEVSAVPGGGGLGVSGRF